MRNLKAKERFQSPLPWSLNVSGGYCLIQNNLVGKNFIELSANYMLSLFDFNGKLILWGIDQNALFWVYQYLKKAENGNFLNMAYWGKELGLIILVGRFNEKIKYPFSRKIYSIKEIISLLEKDGHKTCFSACPADLKKHMTDYLKHIVKK